MKIKKFSEKPTDIKSRVGAKSVVCYPNDKINDNLKILHEARKHLKKIDEVISEIDHALVLFVLLLKFVQKGTPSKANRK